MASYVNGRVGNLYMLWRDSCASSWITPRNMFVRPARKPLVSLSRYPHHVNRGIHVSIDHHYDLPVIRGSRKNLLTVRRASNKSERYPMFITGTNCYIVDHSTVKQCNFLAGPLNGGDRRNEGSSFIKCIV